VGDRLNCDQTPGLMHLLMRYLQGRLSCIKLPLALDLTIVRNRNIVTNWLRLDI
jgi:hypothetical protein